MTTLNNALAAVDRLPAVEPCTIAVACEVIHERKRQTVRWGVQQLPDGTGSDRAQVYADAMKRICDRADADGIVTWAQVLLEEVAEAMAEKPGAPNLRTELLQIAAVACSWVEDIDRRRAHELATAERDLNAARDELVNVEHGADDTDVQQRYVAALHARNEARRASGLQWGLGRGLL